MEKCIFCQIINNEIPSFKVYEDDDVLAFLDINQVTPGHTLVISKQHYTNIFDIPKETFVKVQKVVYDLTKDIVDKMGAEGANILSNNNAVAGQTVMHYHTHIIPRYADDDAFKVAFEKTNFNLEQIHEQITGELHETK